MPALPAFENQFLSYLSSAQAARDTDRHHDYRRELFLDFLKLAFSVKTAEVDVEQFIKIDIRKRGWIDALFRNIILEFKRNLENERADGLRELRDYLRSLPYGDECIGMLTDGLTFEVYKLDDSRESLRPLDTLNLEQKAADVEMVFLWFDSYLFSQTGIVPTSADIVQRFGARSPSFQSALQILAQLLHRVKDTTALQMKQKQWGGVLAKVYGSDVGFEVIPQRNRSTISQSNKFSLVAVRGLEIIATGPGA
jgi:hypothetical protein